MYSGDEYYDDSITSPIARSTSAEPEMTLDGAPAYSYPVTLTTRVVRAYRGGASVLVNEPEFRAMRHQRRDFKTTCPLTLFERQSLKRSPVTLDGKPARIVAIKCEQLGRIIALDDSAELWLTWDEIAAIDEQGGAFSTSK